MLPTLLSIGVCVGACVMAASRRGNAQGSSRHLIGTGLFGWFVVVSVATFLLNVPFTDSQTYRYLVTAYGALAVILAAGILALPRVAGLAMLIVLMTGFAAQQAKWYMRQPPDGATRSLIRCLEQQGIHAAYADYWVSYKLSFVSAESIIAAPFTAMDRYPAYTRYVAQQPLAASIAVPPPAGRIVEREFECAGVPIVVSRRE